MSNGLVRALRVEDYMSSPVIVVKPQDTLAHARNLMLRHRVSRLVVVDDAGKPMGMLTTSDFARLVDEGIRKPLDQVTVDTVMTPNPVTVNLKAPLREAAELMLRHNISGLPVVDDDGVLVGIITKTDITRAFVERGREEFKVKDYMDTDLATASPFHSISYVLEQLNSKPYRRVLIVDEGRLVGIVAPRDITFFEHPLLRAPKLSSKTYRKFAELPKGRIGPVYNYLMIIALDVMTPDPITVSPDDTLTTAARLMLSKGISSLPVTCDDEPVGILVKHHIVKAFAEL